MNLSAYEKEHMEKLRNMGAECTTFLRRSGAFPLMETGKLALYGSGARRTLAGGTGSGEVNSRFFITAEQGLLDAGFELTTKNWLDGYDRVVGEAHKAFIQDIRDRAKKKHTMAILEGMGAVMPEPEYDLPLDGEGSAAIYVLSRISGEGNDRNAVPGDIFLSRTEERDILTLNQKYERFLLVLNVGGPVDLSPLDDVKDILLLSQLGAETGHILADIITGKAYPSGKLTTTWARWEDYCTIGTFGESDNTYYREGVYVGYRYFDSVGKRAMFPFGFGLGYTDFAIEPAGISAADETITVTAKVKNIGLYTGKEVAELYVSVPGKKLNAPYQALAAWKKTSELRAGAETEVSLSFRLTEIASFDSEHNRYFLESGDYILRLGAHSNSTQICGIVRLSADATVKRVSAKCGRFGMTDWRPDEVRETIIPEDIPVVVVDAAAIREEVIDYYPEAEISPIVKSLSNEQLAYLNVGEFSSKPGSDSIIGNAGQAVAGAAGETTSKLKSLGLNPLVMADGPAGLRIARRYTTDAGGVHSLDDAMPRMVMELMSPLQSKMMSLMKPKPKPDAVIHEQYCTAIPIGTAVAQSWNPIFAEACGDIVGDEMERFGVHLWLAPAMNIHRNIRCGRNFEYFSEDPLISGKIAAAITRGVQKHPGRGVTIKHYAANNQETNRNGNSSWVSERAMREIYLKGFEICVKESSPCAVMSSYNLINGQITSSHKGVFDILRCEFGFDGIIMTDWIVSGMAHSIYGEPQAYAIAAAGGNLMMPGCKNDWKNIISGLKTGKLTREQLLLNAEQTIRLVRKLTAQDK